MKLSLSLLVFLSLASRAEGQYRDCCGSLVSTQSTTISQFQSACRTLCGTDPNSCCGTYPSTSLNKAQYAIQCSNGCSTSPQSEVCCGSMVSTQGKTLAQFQADCRAVCGPDPSTCCGTSPSTLLNQQQYAQQCSLDCSTPTQSEDCCGTLVSTIGKSLTQFQADCRAVCGADPSSCCGTIPSTLLGSTLYAVACSNGCGNQETNYFCCGIDVLATASLDAFKADCDEQCSGINNALCCGIDPDATTNGVILDRGQYAAACTVACESCPDAATTAQQAKVVVTRTGRSCFSPANTVEVEDKGLMSIDSLKIGDSVRVGGKNRYSRVYSFLHLDPEADAEYLQIYAEGLKTPLEVSPEHMVFIKGALFPVRASQIKVGDMLGEAKVAEIKSVKRRGSYAPVTESGDIVVSGILASSYAAVHHYTPINQHAEAHAFFALRRLMCAFNFGICENETYTNGFPQWLSPMVHFAEDTEKNAPAQLFATVVGLPLIAAAYILEQTFRHPALVSAFIVGILSLKKSKKSKTKNH